MSCCAGDTCGIATGELAGIAIPGACIWGEADGDGDGLGLVVLLVGVRLARGAGLFLGGARLAFGLGFAAGLGMT